MGGEGGGSVNDCDIFIYNRGYMEAWGFYEISSNIDAGAYITLPGGRRIRLGIDVRGGTTIRYPFCEDSEKNCCLKSHVNGPISYL